MSSIVDLTGEVETVIQSTFTDLDNNYSHFNPLSIIRDKEKYKPEMFESTRNFNQKYH